MAKAWSHRSIEAILGRLEEEGRGIVLPWSPTLKLRWEWMVSVRREVIGKRVAKSTYSPFVMAVEVTLSDGWRGKAVGSSGEATRLKLDRKRRRRKKGKPVQKKPRCLGGNYQLEDCKGKVVDVSC